MGVQDKSNTSCCKNKAVSGFHHIQFIASYLFLYGSYGVLLPYLPVYYDSLNINAVNIGILGMIPNIASFTCAPLWSLLSDSYNMKNEVLLFTLVGSIITTLLFLLTPDNNMTPYIFAVLSVSSFFRAPIGSLVDSIVMQKLKDNSDYGKMRLWGAIGFGCLSFIGGLLSTQAPSTIDAGLEGEGKSCPRGSCFTNLFYVYAGCGSITLLVFITFRLDLLNLFSSKMTSKNSENELELANTAKGESSSNDNGGENGHQAPSKLESDEDGMDEYSTIELLRHVFVSQPSVLLFSLVIFLSGMGTGVIDTFLFIRLKEIGASGLAMGCARFVTCAAEVPLFQVASHLQSRFGIWPLVGITQLAFVVRFLYYSVLSNPWSVLPAETLHGFTYAVTWSVACSYATLISPPKIQSTMLALLESLHWGLGGVGSVIGGFVYHYYGAVVLFQGCAVMCSISSMIAFASWLCCNPPHATPSIQKYSHVDSSVHNGLNDEA